MCTPDYSEIFHVIVLISIVITVLDHFFRNRRSQTLSYSDQQSRTRNNRTFVLTRALAPVWHRSYSDTLGVQKESLAHESWWKIHHAWVNKAKSEQQRLRACRAKPPSVDVGAKGGENFVYIHSRWRGEAGRRSAFLRAAHNWALIPGTEDVHRSHTGRAIGLRKGSGFQVRLSTNCV